MKQVIGNDGRPIKGLYRMGDGSLKVHDPEGYKQKKQVADNFQALHNDVSYLKEQLAELMKRVK